MQEGGALEDQHSTFISTYGIIFMRTPHQGGNEIALGQALVNIASIFIKADDRTLKFLKRDSECLQEQIVRYASISGQFCHQVCLRNLPTPIALGKSLL